MKLKSISAFIFILFYIISWFFWGQKNLIESDIDFTLSDLVGFEQTVDTILFVNYNSFIFKDTFEMTYRNLHVISSNFSSDPDFAGNSQYYDKITKKYKTNYLCINESYFNFPPLYFGTKYLWEYGTDSIFENKRICIWLGYKWLEFEFQHWPWE